MSKKSMKLALAIALMILPAFAVRLLSAKGRDKDTKETSIAAVAGEKGGQDTYGRYELVKDWPKPLEKLPGHEKWTWGTVSGVFAESPDRVYILEQGEVPTMKRPKT